MRILGIDPGLATIGIGLLEAKNARSMQSLDWLTITTKAGGLLPQRLAEIAKDLDALVQDMKPDRAVIEKIYFSTNKQTAIDVAQARGVILQVVASHAIPIVEITPMQLKSAITGDGQADKRQIQDMLVHMLKLDEIPHPDDAADALALAVYGAITMQN